MPLLFIYHFNFKGKPTSLCISHDGLRAEKEGCESTVTKAGFILQTINRKKNKLIPDQQLQHQRAEQEKRRLCSTMDKPLDQ